MSSLERDRSLVRRMLAGDESAFEIFSEEYVPAVYRFAARRLGGDRELTKDVVQTTVVKVMSKLDSFRGEAALVTWMCACCRNEIAGHFRRRSGPVREVELEVVAEASPGRLVDERTPGADELVEAAETRERVHDALDALPARYGKALEWKYLEGASVRDIARRLELSPKAAESLLTRARNAFRETFDPLVSPSVSTAGATAGREMRLES